MAAVYKKTNGLEFRNGNWWTKLAIPADVRAALGKTAFLKNLKTDDVLVARQASEGVRAEWRRMIAEARSGTAPEAIAAKAKEWAEGQRYAKPQGLMASELWAEFGMTFTGEDHYVDTKMAALVRHGLMARAALMPEHPAPVLDDVAGGSLALKKALASRASLVAKAQHADLQTAEFEADAYGKASPRACGPKPVVVSGTTLGALFDLFLEVNNKRQPTLIARNRQHLRRLGEFMGDGNKTDIGFVTKAKVTAFWSELRMFPARRNAMQNSATFSKVVAGQKRAAGTDAFKATQTDETLAEWLGFYRQIFQFAVVHDLIASDPWVVVTHKVDKSGLKGKPYTPDEIKMVFGSALYVGHLADDKWRITPGDKVFKDAKFWLPVVALFSGTRLSEMAASPLNSISQIDDVWCLDLTERSITSHAGPRVKNYTARRYVPIHRELIRLGFIDYVEKARGQGEVWLFPDLDHESRHGPGHAFSKWWGSRQKKIGIGKTFHELRHTWKRAAREAGLSEERSDLLSGHGGGSMGRDYGKGVGVVSLLKADMDMIAFPTFPV